MATTTTNYGLKKPESTDLVSVVPFNENFDTIDTLMLNNSNAASKAQSTANSAQTAASNAQNTASNAQSTANGKITNGGSVATARALTASEYNAIGSKDSNTIYFVKS